MFKDRLENKFTIPASLLSTMRQYLLNYCDLDFHSQNESDGFYHVNSLYFDSPDFLFLKNRILKVTQRFNMRYRSYGKDPTSAPFTEMKFRDGEIVRKTREKPNSNSEAPLTLFAQLRHRYNAEPKVAVKYRRLAFSSRWDSYARVTFDQDLFSHAPLSGGFPNSHSKEWVACDESEAFDPGCSVILELKSEINMPQWMQRFIQEFDLKRRSFSKYSQSLKFLFHQHSHPYLAWFNN